MNKNVLFVFKLAVCLAAGDNIHPSEICADQKILTSDFHGVGHNCAKALHGQRYQGGLRGSGPKGADDLRCFHLGLNDGIRAWRLELGP